MALNLPALETGKKRVAALIFSHGVSTMFIDARHRMSGEAT
jgi:hypothetical protein